MGHTDDCYGCDIRSGLRTEHNIACPGWQRFAKATVGPTVVVDWPNVLASLDLTSEIHEQALTTPDEKLRIGWAWTRDEVLAIRHLRADWLEGRR